MSLAFYVQNTDSSDDHSGSSASVIASGSSTADVTQGNATIDLSDAAPDLSGVNQSETRDTIRLDGRSDGINGTDVFEIISVDDENDTVEVSPTPTQASQSDLDWCIGGPFASCQRAADVERAGDHIYVKVGTYQPVGADNWLIKIKHAGTAGSPIVWEGYRATPGDADDYLQAHLDLLPEDGTFDDYRPVLDGSVSSDDGIMVDGGFGQNPCYHTFRHFDVSACIIGLNTQVSGGYATRVRLVNSKLTACVLPVYCSACDLDGCDVVNSAMGGMWVPNGASVYGCAVHNSNGGGFGSNSGKFTLMFSRFWDLGGDAVMAPSNPNQIVITNNTFIGNDKVSGKYALDVKSTAQALIANNIFHDWDTAVHGDADPGENFVVRNNLYGDNNTNRDNFPEGLGDICADDPRFVDADNGDYRLRYDSPARGAGWPSHLDIGAFQRQRNHHGLLRTGAE